MHLHCCQLVCAKPIVYSVLTEFTYYRDLWTDLTRVSIKAKVPSLGRRLENNILLVRQGETSERLVCCIQNYVQRLVVRHRGSNLPTFAFRPTPLPVRAFATCAATRPQYTGFFTLLADLAIECLWTFTAYYRPGAQLSRQEDDNSE